jgi:hypothetical protein
MAAPRLAATPIPKLCIPTPRIAQLPVAKLGESRVTAGGNTLLPDNQQTPASAPSVSPASKSANPLVLPYTGFQLWMHRLNVLVFVFLCAAMGVLLVIVPWWPQWTDNYYLLGHPTLRALVSDGFTRGISSGLGILDIWIGFSAAINYREDRPA